MLFDPFRLKTISPLLQVSKCYLTNSKFNPITDSQSLRDDHLLMSLGLLVRQWDRTPGQGITISYGHLSISISNPGPVFLDISFTPRYIVNI